MGTVPEGFDWPLMDEEPQLNSPGDELDPEMLKYYASKM